MSTSRTHVGMSTLTAPDIDAATIIDQARADVAAAERASAHARRLFLEYRSEQTQRTADDATRALEAARTHLGNVILRHGSRLHAI